MSLRPKPQLKPTQPNQPSQPSQRKPKNPASIHVALRRAYGLALAHHGHQHWWPGDSPFEVCVGAILTQNTNWGNVERAIRHLKNAGVLSPLALYDLPQPQLAQLIRSTGYFNVKARRLRAFLEVLVEQYGADLNRLFAGTTLAVRERLLAIKGIGPETADSLLLYAGGHPSFVIDAYTRRIFSRHQWCASEANYHDLQQLCMVALSRDCERDLLDYWQDYHAQLVNIGKEFCRPRLPRCEGCPWRSLLPETAV
jgi:endonuclease-3 related protein